MWYSISHIQTPKDTLSCINNTWSWGSSCDAWTSKRKVLTKFRRDQYCIQIQNCMYIYSPLTTRNVSLVIAAHRIAILKDINGNICPSLAFLPSLACIDMPIWRAIGKSATDPRVILAIRSSAIVSHQNLGRKANGGILPTRHNEGDSSCPCIPNLDVTIYAATRKYEITKVK